MQSDGMWHGFPAHAAHEVRRDHRRGRDGEQVLQRVAAHESQRLEDPVVVEALGFMSGHTLKHLLAVART